jgi:DNA-directed RNA polymerase specialized sigma24 family protein
MSPLPLRRFRAERLLREDFEALRAGVLANVARRLRASGVELDRADLEACYAAAWQGLYAAVLDGREIESPRGWLALVTFRRAIEDHRASVRARRFGERAGEQVQERDLAAELDDRGRLRQWLLGLRSQLDVREREAAALCYLHGLSRAEAAARMGLSEAGMRKLMEGRGPARPGVARKVGRLARTIAEGSWCEEHASLMRALAYGILDPDGERYRVALAHREECPACRAYVLSLRGLAATLPPVALPAGPVAHLLGLRVIAHAHAGAAPALAGAGGAAGGSWTAAGPLSGKLAVGCVLALGAGAGCVTLVVPGGTPTHPPPRRVEHARASHQISRATEVAPTPPHHIAVTRTAHPTAPSPAVAAAREFGPEQPTTTATQAPPAAHAAATSKPTTASRAVAASSPTNAAAREFGPG